MFAVDHPLLVEFNESDRLHLQHLAMIRPQLPSDSQLQMLEGLAVSLQSPRLLALMARTPHWLAQWPILQGLSENEYTPEPLRRDLELVVSLFDQMREMDSAPVDEKDERSDSVKAVYQQLPPTLKPVAKLLAKQLAKNVSSTGTTMEMPALPGEDADWEALLALPEVVEEVIPPEPVLSREELLARARGTAQPEELLQLLISEDPDLRQAAFTNAMLSEELLCQALGRAQAIQLFEEVYGEARWYFREPVRASLRDSPGCPEELARKVGLSEHLVTHLSMAPRDHKGLLRAASLFTQLDESEFQFITYWAKRHAPQLLRVVKYFYDRLQRHRSSLSGSLPARAEEGRWASLEERVFLANQATQADQLAQVLQDPDLQVFKLALENPALTPRLMVAAIPALDRDRAELLAVHRNWGGDPQVREALLHNVHIGEPTALRLLADLSQPKSLMEVLRNPRLPHLEVKRRALDSLRNLYLSLDTQQRISAIRASGGELMRHLPQDVLQDEETLKQLVSDRQLDPSILLRLARNKLTPRGVLEQIAGHPVLLAHPAIMSELLLNPKTPRDSSIRIWGLLSDSEQQQLLRSPHLPATLRNMV